jgi:phosphate transport system substrate-binding protein
MTVKSSTLRLAVVPAALALAVSLAACGGQNEADATGSTAAGGSATSGGAASGEVIADGSSTVGPLTEAAAELFKKDNPGVNITVQTSGTGGGFEKFCQNQTDLSNASRAIKDEEKAVCDAAGIKYTELLVATDALTVVVSKDNTFLTCLTTAELKKLWEPAAEGKVTTWNQVNPKFPNEKITLYGAGTDSGTFDYFTDEINGEEGVSRTDYNATEDDNVTVQGVSGDKNALGYFGYTYFEENADKLKAVQVDSGNGCVTPSAETAQDGSYTPLARPLFIYVKNAAYTSKPQVKAFVDWYAANDAVATKAAQFIPLNAEQQKKLTDAVGAIA